MPPENEVTHIAPQAASKDGVTSRRNDRLPELREFVKENDERLYSFCFYMLSSDFKTEEFTLSIFREFGDFFRRYSARTENALAPHEIRLRLYQIAWEKIRDTIARTQFTWTVGRDTRQLKGLDDDLLKAWASASAHDDPAALDNRIIDRLRRIDADFRAPVVLHDILGFEDDEVVSILGIRWGVYRHRLHRGRLELRDTLRGRPISHKPSTSHKDA